MAQSKLLVHPGNAADGVGHRITPGQRRMALCRLRDADAEAGRDVSSSTPAADEVCIVILSGKARVTADGFDSGAIGERASVFDGLPWSVYLPPHSAATIEAASDCELALCSAPASGRLKARVIKPGDVGTLTRGSGSNARFIRNVLPEDAEAESLLVVEVITPGGNWSSYPPHKHDRDALPDESYLEETYYHRLKPRAGLRLPARLHRRPLARRDADGRGRRRRAGAARLPSGRRAARLRPLLPQHDGRPEARLALPQRPRARVADEISRASREHACVRPMPPLTRAIDMRGHCLCGKVEFEIDGSRFKLYQCHCSLCRRQSGSSSNAAAIISAEKFRWLRGAEFISSWVKDTGFRSDFCSRCGSPVPNPLRNMPYVWVPAGLLEDGGELEIAAHLCVASKTTACGRRASPNPNQPRAISAGMATRRPSAPVMPTGRG